MVFYHRQMISEAVVEATWRECAGMAPAEARVRINNLGRSQPALLAYVLAESESLAPAAEELAVYLFFVIARMFYRGGATVRRVSLAAVQACAEDIEARLAALQGSHVAFLERAALVLSGRQPYVYRYLVETVFEAPTSKVGPIPLTPEEQGAVFLLLATVISALEEKGLSEKRIRDAGDQPPDRRARRTRSRPPVKPKR